MKTIGLIGGMSWESTTTYYQLINETIKKELGGLHSAKILLYSVDFAEIEHYQASGDWAKSAEVLSQLPRNWSRLVRTLLSSAPTPCTRLPRRFKSKSRFRFCTLRRQLLRLFLKMAFKKLVSWAPSIPWLKILPGKTA